MSDTEPSRKKVRTEESEDQDVSMASASSSSSSSLSSLSSSASVLSSSGHGASGNCCVPTMPFHISPDLQEEVFHSQPVELVQSLLKSAGLFKLLPQVAAFKFEGAETIFKAKNVLLVNEGNQVLSPGWVATRSGNIVAVGDESAIQPWQGTHTKFFDLGDATLIPGLIESHMHILGFGVFLRMVDCGREFCSTVKEVYERLAEAASKTERDWVLGWNFDKALLETPEDFDCDEMNKYVSDKRVVLMHASMHIAFVNRCYLDFLKIKEGVEPPEHGEFGYDDKGKLTGELREVPCVTMIMHTLPPLTHEAIMRAGMRAAAYLHRRGVTTATDAGTGMLALENDFHCYQDLAASKSIPLRVICMPLQSAFPKPMFHTGFGTKWCYVGAMKFILDGSMQGFTAHVTEPYFTQPDNYGIPGMTANDFRDRALYAHTHGFQLAVHCNGDAALDVALNTIEWLLEVHPREDHRHRIEHCQTPRPDQLERIKKLSVVANFFVAHTHFYGDWHLEKTLGPERAPRISPLRSAQKLGIPFTIHSDAPVTRPGPLQHMQYAMCRTTLSGQVLGPDERVDVQTALRAVTIDAAYASHCEANLGSIEVGKLADMAILAENPYEVAPDKVGSIKVLGTVSGGVHFPVTDDA